MTNHEHKTVSKMAKLGGTFARHLALLYINASAEDQGKIRATWPEIWEIYSTDKKEEGQ